MPHLTIEYSANLEQHVAISELVDIVHEAAASTGVFPLAGIRTRAARRDVYRISDGAPENTFVHLTALIAPGRDAETKKRAGETIFAALTGALAPVFDNVPIAASFAIAEIDNDFFYRKSTLHQHQAAKSAA